ADREVGDRGGGCRICQGVPNHHRHACDHGGVLCVLVFVRYGPGERVRRHAGYWFDCKCFYCGVCVEDHLRLGAGRAEKGGCTEYLTKHFSLLVTCKESI